MGAGQPQGEPCTCFPAVFLIRLSLTASAADDSQPPAPSASPPLPPRRASCHLSPPLCLRFAMQPFCCTPTPPPSPTCGAPRFPLHLPGLATSFLSVSRPWFSAPPVVPPPTNPQTRPRLPSTSGSP